MRYGRGKRTIVGAIWRFAGRRDFEYTIAPIRVAAVGTVPNSSLRLRKHLQRAFNFWPYLFIGFSVIGLACLFWPLIR